MVGGKRDEGEDMHGGGWPILTSRFPPTANYIQKIIKKLHKSCVYVHVSVDLLVIPGFGEGEQPHVGV